MSWVLRSGLRRRRFARVVAFELHRPVGFCLVRVLVAERDHARLSLLCVEAGIIGGRMSSPDLTTAYLPQLQ